MNVAGVAERTIRPTEDGAAVEIIDQTQLPFAFVKRRIGTLAEAAEAISAMRVRGAPLIGVTAAYGLALALERDASDAGLRDACERLVATRPTAVNLRFALEAMRAALQEVPPADRIPPDSSWVELFVVTGHAASVARFAEPAPGTGWPALREHLEELRKRLGRRARKGPR